MEKSISDEDLVENLYASATSPERLRGALGFAIDKIGATGGNIHIVRKDTLGSVQFLTVGPNYTPAAIAAYFEHWRHVNIHRAAMRQTKGVFLCHEHLTNEILARAPYAQDFYYKMGERWLAGAVAHEDRQYEISLVFNRCRGEAPFDENDKRFIRLLIPHVRRAAALLANQIDSQNQDAGIANGLSQSHLVVWLVDGTGKLEWSNKAGETFLQESRLFKVQNGRLACIADADQQKFSKCLAGVAARRIEESYSQSLCLGDGFEAIELEILPATVPNGAHRDGRAMNLVVGSRRGRAACKVADLKRRHALTSAEAEIALAIAEGLRLEEVAKIRSVSKETARSQLRAVFNKTGATHQAQLAALVWRTA